MPTVSVYNYFTVTVGDQTYTGGSLSSAQSIATGSVVFDKSVSVANTTLTELLQVGSGVNDDIGDFDFLFITSDQDGDIQLVTNEGGVIGGSNLENGFVLKLHANKPLMLCNDDSRNRGDMAAGVDATNYAAEMDTWETTWAADTIDRVEFYHSTGTAATVRIFAVT